MINKKQFLGHKPVELGYKDAICPGYEHPSIPLFKV